MNKEQAINVLREQDRKGRYVFSNHDLYKLFPEDSFKTFNEGLSRLAKSGILKRACRGVYVNEEARQFDSYTIERIAKTLRRGEYNYVSLESILSEYGVISQIPIDRLNRYDDRPQRGL
jgi:predicted transcriptional regulator of viral defense system